jgi:uncharacterized membrane protein
VLQGLQHPLADSRWLYWTGWETRKPITEDFVPVFPWAAPLLLGLAAARWPALVQRLHGPAPAALVRLGRWPLSFYLLHQPLLIGLILLAETIAA